MDASHDFRQRAVGGGRLDARGLALEERRRRRPRRLPFEVLRDEAPVRRDALSRHAHRC
jgi:hypothetical protein